jgi:hypothetical protein
MVGRTDVDQGLESGDLNKTSVVHDLHSMSNILKGSETVEGLEHLVGVELEIAVDRLKRIEVELPQILVLLNVKGVN